MMKHLQRALIAFSLLALVFIGCKKEYSYEVPGGSSSGSYQWSFTEAANAYKGPMDTAYMDTVGTTHLLTMAGHSTDGKDIISLQIIADTIQVGTYQTAKCSFDYLRSNVVTYGSDLTAIGQFTVSITAIDSISITGTFSGTALDTAKNKKNITDGKFKVKFKSSVVSTNNCKISALTFVDSVSGFPYYAFNALYSGNTLSQIVLTDSSTVPAHNDNTFPVATASGKITLDGAVGKQYFTTDASGRITGYYGYEDPTSDTSNQIIVTYTFDGTGHLTKRSQSYKAAPGIVVFEMTYTWSGSLITQTILKYAGIKVAQVDYTYDAGKSVKNFLYLHPYAPEILLFQPAINAGVVPDQALVKAVETYFDPTTGAAAAPNISILQNYTIDANKYVKAFQVAGADFTAVGLNAATNYKLAYHCF